jgi:hypothetical protein
MKNTPVAREFKKRLVKKFFEMAEELKQPAAKLALPQVSALEYVKLIRDSLPNLGEASLQEIISRATRIDFREPLFPCPSLKKSSTPPLSLRKNSTYRWPPC